MERLYENKGFTRRQNISAAVLVAVVLYGFFELYVAFGSEAGDSTSAMFGVLFIGGGLYGAKTIWDEGRDLVVALDDASGTVTVSLWRPLRELKVAAPVAALTGWRHFVKVGKRNAKVHFLTFRAPGYPHPLQIEMRPGEPVTEGLRRIAGEAVEEYEIATGIRRAADDGDDDA